MKGATGAVTLGHTYPEDARTRRQEPGRLGAGLGGWMLDDGDQETLGLVLGGHL